MFTDYQIQALKDYQIDPTKMNLDVFALSVNPSFNMTKRNTSVVKDLISKFSKDGSDVRLNALQAFLQPIPVQSVLNQNTLDALLANKDSIKLQVNGSLSSSDMKSYRKVSPSADLERRAEIYISLFGSWKEVGTLSYSLITPNGAVDKWHFSDNEMADSRSYSNKSIMQPEIVIKWTEEITGKPIINFYDIHSNKYFGVGNLSTYVFKRNGLRDFRFFDNLGHDGNYKELSGLNSIPSNMPMQNVFSQMDIGRRRMQ